MLFLFFFFKILQLDKFEGADFNCGNSFFEILAQKYLTNTFLVSTLGIFAFSWNFAIRQILVRWFKKWL